MIKAEKNYFSSVTTKDSPVFRKYLAFLKNAGVKTERQNICDIGCATGNFISEIIEDNNCFGVDNSDYAVGQCRKRYSKIKNHFAAVDLNCDQKLPFRRQFDLLTMFDVIEHIDNLKNLKVLIDGSLKSGGHIMITTPNANNFLRILNRGWFTGEMDKTHINLFTPYTLDFFLRKAGFERVALFTPYNFHFKNNWITEKLLLGGQIVAIYRLKRDKIGNNR